MIDIKGCTRIFGVGSEGILQWIHKRNMPAYKIGGLWKFKLSEVDKWVRSGGASEESNTENNEQT